MKRILTLIAALLAASFPAVAQTPIPAPAGWGVQTRAGGAQTYTPSDLAAGEKYSLTAYDSAPLGDKTLEEYLRAFAGAVGAKPGQLAAPLDVKVSEGRTAVGTGVYRGPDGTTLAVMFLGVSLDGGRNIHVARVLASPSKLLDRYLDTSQALLRAMARRAKAEAGDNLLVVPPEVTGKMKPGGDLVPGVYAGNQYSGSELRYRLRVYVYPTGEYRICDQNDGDYHDEFHEVSGTGTYSYSRNSGRLDLDRTFDMSNSSLASEANEEFCYFGRDADNKPMIYAEEGVFSRVTTLRYVGPPTKRLSRSQEDARKAAAEAEKNRFKWVTPPGKGVQDAQIAAVLLDSKSNGQSADETVYLLLRDGTVYAGLPVPPDELDVIRSRQREPDKWGRWRKTPKGYQVSWNGAPPQGLPGDRMTPAPAQVKLRGRWGTGRSYNDIITSSYALWGVTFTPGGRFTKDRQGGASSTLGFGDDATRVNSGYDDAGSYGGANGPGFAVASSRKNNPHGDREGDYSLNGYVLTLRYDNGRVARLPFFFLDAEHKGLWFEGASMTRDDGK